LESSELVKKKLDEGGMGDVDESRVNLKTGDSSSGVPMLVPHHTFHRERQISLTKSYFHPALSEHAPGKQGKTDGAPTNSNESWNATNMKVESLRRYSPRPR
jgi:hypothetical protein